MWWWSRLDDDLDVMMIQTWWWSRCVDDPVVVMMQIPWWRKTWSRIWLEDKEDSKTNNTWRWRWWDDLVDIEKKTSANKLCRENTFLVNMKCLSICNFEMYSFIYLMYCTSMFIPRHIYNVIESCHVSMFRSGDSIM